MKERPILFSGPMVRAILDGRKTQTRRVVKAHHLRGTEEAGQVLSLLGIGMLSEAATLCPFGQPGDRLWVRETWRQFDSSVECACYDDCKCASYNGKPVYRADFVSIGEKWRPSIHMPRWASRITLEIETVRVERLQEISDEDAIEEGINRISHGRNGYYYSAFKSEPDPTNWCHAGPAYKELWQSINGPGSWDANPWVWVIQFRRVKP